MYKHVCSCMHVVYQMGLVVQSRISANSGLEFSPLKTFVYFCTSVYFKTSEKKTPIAPDKISEKNISKFINKLLINLL